MLFKSNKSQLNFSIPHNSKLKLKYLSDDAIGKLCNTIIPFYNENTILTMINHIFSSFIEFVDTVIQKNEFDGKKSQKLMLYISVISSILRIRCSFGNILLPLLLPIFDRISIILPHYKNDEMIIKEILNMYNSLLNNNVYLYYIIDLFYYTWTT